MKAAHDSSKIKTLPIVIVHPEGAELASWAAKLALRSARATTRGSTKGHLGHREPQMPPDPLRTQYKSAHEFIPRFAVMVLMHTVGWRITPSPKT